MTSVVERSAVPSKATRPGSAADASPQPVRLTDDEYRTLLLVNIGELTYDASNARSTISGGAYHTLISSVPNNTFNGICVTDNVEISGRRNRGVIYVLPSTEVIVSDDAEVDASESNLRRVTIVRITPEEMAIRLRLVPWSLVA